MNDVRTIISSSVISLEYIRSSFQFLLFLLLLLLICFFSISF